jgi:hypothetical protein
MFVLGQTYFHSLSFVYFEELYPIPTTTRLLDLEFVSLCFLTTKSGDLAYPCQKIDIRTTSILGKSRCMLPNNNNL